MAVLIAAVVLVHLGGMVAYRASALDAASTAHAIQLAERLATAARAIAVEPIVKRDQTAHEMSSVGLSLHWSNQTAVGTDQADDPRLATLRAALAVLLPGESREDIRAGFEDHEPSAEPHAILGSLRLADGSFIGFRVPLITGTEPDLRATLVSTSLLAGCVAVIAILLMRSVGSPLRGLAKAADAIGTGTAVTVAENGPDEVRQVARAFNRMQARIHLLISDRTHALAAVSHDLRTPITRLRLRAGFLADTELQATIDADLDEMEAMIDATLAYLRGDTDPEMPSNTDLAAMLATLVDDASDAGRPATFEGPRQVYLAVRSLGLKRAFTNIIDNALSYGGVARVTLSERGAAVLVRVDDDGPGIPDGEIDGMFQPFKRLDASRNRRTGGVGLGLTIAKKAIEGEGGTIELANRAEGGLRAEIVLPRSGGHCHGLT